MHENFRYNEQGEKNLHNVLEKGVSQVPHLYEQNTDNKPGRKKSMNRIDSPSLGESS